MKAIQWTVFIDMLGYKKLNSAIESEEQLQHFMSFLDGTQKLLPGYEALVGGYYEATAGFRFHDWYEVKSACISDSIVVTFKPKEVASEKNPQNAVSHSANVLMLACFRIAALMSHCLLENQITFRGGISNGLCDLVGSTAAGPGLAAAVKAETSAVYARIALADDVISNKALVRKVRWLFRTMYGGANFLVTEGTVTYVNVLELMLAVADTSSPAVQAALRSESGREATRRAISTAREYLEAQRELVRKSIREFYAAYRADYAVVALRETNRRVLKKYFWLRRHHNQTVEGRGMSDFCI